MSISDISSITLKFNLSPATRVPNLLLPGPEQQEEPPRGPPLSSQTLLGVGVGGAPEAVSLPQAHPSYSKHLKTVRSLFSLSAKPVRVENKTQMKPSCQPLRSCPPGPSDFSPKEGSSYPRAYSCAGHPRTGSHGGGSRWGHRVCCSKGGQHPRRRPGPGDHTELSFTRPRTESSCRESWLARPSTCTVRL